MNKKQRRTLERIRENPIRSDIKWSEIESLFEALGAEIRGGGGSMLAVKLNKVRFVFHSPHPSPNTKKHTIVKIRRFLEEAGVDLSLKDFDRISNATPCICNLRPAGEYFMEDLDYAGGIPAVLSRLKSKLKDNITVSFFS